jgi:antitoxin YefM
VEHNLKAVSATEARKQLFNLIQRALRAHDPVRIQHREGGVVLVSEEDYEGLLETIELLSIPGMRESIAEAEADLAAGRVASVNEVFGDD